MAFCPPPYPGFFVGEFVKEGTHKHKKGEEEGEKKELLKQAAVDQVGFLSPYSFPPTPSRATQKIGHEGGSGIRVSKAKESPLLEV